MGFQDTPTPWYNRLFMDIIHHFPGIKTSHLFDSTGKRRVLRDTTLPIPQLPDLSLPPVIDSLSCRSCGHIIFCKTASTTVDPSITIPVVCDSATSEQKNMDSHSNREEPTGSERKPCTLQCRPLPGRDWMDLVDCWSCHKSEFSVLAGRVIHAAQDSSFLLPKDENTMLFRGHLGVVNRLCVSLAGENCLSCPGCLQALAYSLFSPQISLEQTDSLRLTHVCLFLSQLVIHSPHPTIFSQQDPLIRSQLLLCLLAKDLVEMVDSYGCCSFAFTHASESICFELFSSNTLLDLNGANATGLCPLLILRLIQERPSNSSELSAFWGPESTSFFIESIRNGRLLALQIGLTSCSAIPLNL